MRVDGSERVVRPYALTAGRTKPSGATIDVAAVVSVAGGMLGLDRATEIMSQLGPEHLRMLRCCRPPASVADVATELDLPLGVVRILLADLREGGLVRIRQPVPPGLRDTALLKEVADALRRL
jgi:hypothetical protein